MYQCTYVLLESVFFVCVFSLPQQLQPSMDEAFIISNLQMFGVRVCKVKINPSKGYVLLNNVLNII